MKDGGECLDAFSSEFKRMNNESSKGKEETTFPFLKNGFTSHCRNEGFNRIHVFIVGRRFRPDFKLLTGRVKGFDLLLQS